MLVVNQAYRMLCTNCSADPMKFKLRHFHRLDIKYPVCSTCNRAQRRPKALRTVGRGKRSADRDRVWTALSIEKAKRKFKILVWGPDPNATSPAALKRKQIRDELRKMGHDAFFSEDVDISGVPTNTLELLQVKELSDLIINVAASHGSQAEFDTFALQFEGRRQLVFLDEQSRGGFTATGTLRQFRTDGGTEEFFDEKDLESCALTLMAVDWVVEKSYFQMEQDLRIEFAKSRSLL